MIEEEPLEIVLEDGSLELDRRGGGGIEVVLSWTPRTNQVSVAVVDARTGQDFRFEVPPSEALEAFRHPFAYDCRRGDLPTLELARELTNA